MIMGLFALLCRLNKALHLMNMERCNRFASWASFLLLYIFIGFNSRIGFFIDIMILQGCGIVRVRHYIAFKSIFSYLDITALAVHANTLLCCSGFFFVCYLSHELKTHNCAHYVIFGEGWKSYKINVIIAGDVHQS